MDSYKLHQRLGKGAQGSVFLAENKHDKVLYVLKKVECNDEGEANKAFHEAVALQELQHPHKHPYICGYKEFFVTWDKEEAAMFVCIVMDFYKMGDLDRALKQKRAKGVSIPELVIKKWFGQMVDALTWVHAKSMIHRDLKPSNIFLAEDGSISVGDFGVSTIMDDARTRTRTTVGTMNWMAPEVLERPYDERSDVWSLGCIVLELATCGFLDQSQISSKLFQIKQSPQELEDVLKEVEKAYKTKDAKDLCQTIRIMLRRNFQQRPTMKELAELPYVKGCIALSSKQPKGTGAATKGARKDAAKPVPKDKGVAGVLDYMKKNKDSVACQVQALKHLEQITRKQDVSLNKKAKQQIAETMTNENKKQDPSKDVHLQALKIFINLFPHADDNDVMFTEEIIRPVLSAMKSHITSSELQSCGCQLLMALSAEEAAGEIIGQYGGVQDLLSALRAFPDNKSIASNCCGALWSLAVSENNCKIVSEERGLEDIVLAMGRHNTDVDLVEAACSALWSLSLEEDNVDLMEDLNVIDLIVDAIKMHKKEPKVIKNACMALASIVEAREVCAHELLKIEGLESIIAAYNNLKTNDEVVENICVLFTELEEYDDIREEMKLNANITKLLSEAKSNFSDDEHEDLLRAAADALVKLGGGQRNGQRTSSARSRPRSAARKC
ncbi:serine/threonine kinase-like domain-containing protein STKLD1 isoform X1 [Pocillopora verrucosa]|uniref:serine/threonine kinase-like domain-containing protein STKLD1 n=2 Tax=Pocillopora TaxID=46730 RepID=UPI000F54DAD7|nr:serine/threonine kinase-like domain-containing protein STKLD1 [Pocillopora damicornis]XP_058958127.1 serine/threonine kinase-like domain-containing protein STKLD1 [Pocillopora verrucosa]